MSSNKNQVLYGVYQTDYEDPTYLVSIWDSLDHAQKALKQEGDLIKPIILNKLSGADESIRIYVVKVGKDKIITTKEYTTDKDLYWYTNTSQVTLYNTIIVAESSISLEHAKSLLPVILDDHTCTFDREIYFYTKEEEEYYSLTRDNIKYRVHESLMNIKLENKDEE